jgi:predicted PhzF superfamily epimerase YddE/YHI9
VRVDVVRVFCDEHGAYGNRLGVVVASRSTAGREQEIAARLGFSETVVLDALPRRGAGRARLRIFTPTVELPFAGHPTVGTAWWLASRGRPVEVLDVPAGPVPARAEGDLTVVTARAEWAPDFTWTRFGTPEEVEALTPSSFATGSHYAWAWRDEARGAVRARMFAPAFGIAEDEATGAAAIGLTALVGRDLDIRQGAGARLRTRLLSEGVVELGGRVVDDGWVELA